VLAHGGLPVIEASYDHGVIISVLGAVYAEILDSCRPH
jgi:hypothetical protein